MGISACGLTGYLLHLLLRRDQEEDDDCDGILRGPNHKTIELKIPREAVRLVIGRNGKTLRRLQDQSNAKITFRDGGDDEWRVCVIRGTREASNVARDLVRELVESQPMLESVDLYVAQNVVGKIIGRCGERINEISSVSGAKIKVLDAGKGEATRRIVIKGW